MIDRIQWEEIAIGVFLTVIVAAMTGGKPTLGFSEDGDVFMGVLND